MKNIKTVLITTSGTGSRLGQITSHTNKALVPVGDKYALSRIFDVYDNDTEFILTIGYKGHLIKEFCTLAYPEKNIQFVEVDNYDGPGSSLLYSMLKAKDLLQKPFFFHCCDTILPNKIVRPFTTNTLVVAKEGDHNVYSSISVKDGRVTTMHSKGYTESDYCYIGLAYYKDYSTFWELVKTLLKSDSLCKSWSDIHVVQQMLQQKIVFEYEVLPDFYDTGNLESYTKCLHHFTSQHDVLVKHNESLCFLDDRVLKFVSDKGLNTKRIQRTHYLKGLTPKILGQTDHFLSMEYVRGKLLAEDLGANNVSQLLEWAKQHLWTTTKQSDDFLRISKEFYITKTLDRLQKVSLTESEGCFINGIHVPPIQTLLQELDTSFLLTDTFTYFHGDFILDNIIKSSDQQFVLLDWRHEFGSELEWGDVYYDLAKLRHNIIFNHNNIKKELFTVKQEGDHVFIDLKCNYNLVRQLDDFDSFLEKYNYNKKKVKILTAIVWLNMAALYDDPLQKFLYYFGKLHLYLAVSGTRP
jgi:NDP-sugar pyrophosphorylase family protein